MFDALFIIDGTMKWKASSREEYDEGRWQRCHGPSKEGEVKPDLREKQIDNQPAS